MELPSFVHNLPTQKGSILIRYCLCPRNPASRAGSELPPRHLLCGPTATAISPSPQIVRLRAYSAGSCSSSRGDAALHASPIQVDTPSRGSTNRISTNQPTRSRMVSIRSGPNPNISTKTSLSFAQWGARSNTSTRLRTASSADSCWPASRTHCMAYCSVSATLAP